MSFTFTCGDSNVVKPVRPDRQFTNSQRRVMRSPRHQSIRAARDRPYSRENTRDSDDNSEHTFVKAEPIEYDLQIELENITVNDKPITFSTESSSEYEDDWAPWSARSERSRPEMRGRDYEEQLREKDAVIDKYVTRERRSKVALSNAKERILRVETEKEELRLRYENMIRKVKELEGRLEEKEKQIRRHEEQLEAVRTREPWDSLPCIFIQACEDGNMQRMSHCLSLGVDVNVRSEATRLRSGTALLASLSSRCLLRQFETLQHVLSSVRGCVDLNVTDELGNTPLMRACQAGNLSAVKLLTLVGQSEGNRLDVNLSNHLGNTALILAVRANHLGIVNFFREKVNSVDWNKNAPIIDAVMEGNVEIVKVMLEVEDIALTDLPGTFSSVASAAVMAEDGDVVGCVRLLGEDERVVWTEACMEQHGWCRVSPLDFALEHNKVDIVKTLLRSPHLDISSVTQPGHVSVLRDVVLELERETRAKLRLVPSCPQCGGGYPSERPVYQCEQGHLACHHCRHQHCTTCGDLLTTRAHGAQQFIQQFC